MATIKFDIEQNQYICSNCGKVVEPDKYRCPHCLKDLLISYPNFSEIDFDGWIRYIELLIARDSELNAIELDHLLEFLKNKLDDFTEGTWEWEGQNLYNPYMSRCSECGHLGDAGWSYCPHCGSRMK